jgi:hypothetical protein
MSKLKPLLQECLITQKPIKFEKEDGSFSRLLFRAKSEVSRQNKETETWTRKKFYFQLLVLDEKLADSILNSYQEGRLNFITSTEGKLNDFDCIEVNVENEKNGKTYTDYRYSNIQYLINDAVFTYKDIEKKQDTKQEVKASSIKSEPEITGDDEIPF